jgi:hypothetical protein
VKRLGSGKGQQKRHVGEGNKTVGIIDAIETVTIINTSILLRSHCLRQGTSRTP